MRGQILGVDVNSGEGQIAGDDGVRYRFRRDDWSDRVGPAIGATVDFRTSDDRALSVYRLPSGIPATPTAAPPPSDRPHKSRIAAALLAFFLGTFGLHRFYLGRKATGIMMLFLSCTVIGLVVTAPWALVDFVRYLVMSDEDFSRRYP